MSEEQNKQVFRRLIEEGFSKSNLEVLNDGATWSFAATTVAELFQAGGPPDPIRLSSLTERYGVTFTMEWIPELVAKYNLDAPG